MKRLLLTLTVAFSLISLTSFAGEDKKVSRAALEAFQSSFKNATEVGWTVRENVYKAEFALDGQYLAAFYDAEGKLIAMTRNISALELPIALRNSLKQQIDQHWISDLFEVSNEEGTTYYVTLEDADTKVILKAQANSDWSNFQKQRKS